MILKKLFLLIALLFSTVHAENTSKLEIVSQTTNFITLSSTQAPQAWIGIYPLGTSNEFKNVKIWSWVTDTTTTINGTILKDGEYEARLFFNNSFIMETKINFTHLSGPLSNVPRLSDKYISFQKSKEFNLTFRGNPIFAKDWIGIFPKNSLHNHDNLLAWGYVLEGNKVQIKTLNNQSLEIGEYEMVYFLTDTYMEAGNSKTLTITNFQAKYASGISNTLGYVLDSYEYLNGIKQEKDWIAIFNKDDEPIRENIIAWSYINEGIFPREDAQSSIIQFPKLEGIFGEFEGADYKVILFEKDTYNILKVMTPTSI